MCFVQGGEDKDGRNGWVAGIESDMLSGVQKNVKNIILLSKGKKVSGRQRKTWCECGKYFEYWSFCFLLAKNKTKKLKHEK